MALIILQCSFVPQPVSTCTFGYLSVAATAMCEKDQFTPGERGGPGYRLVLNRDGPFCSYSPRAFSTTQAQSLFYSGSGFPLCTKSLFPKLPGFSAASTAVLPLCVPGMAWASCAAVGLGRVIVRWSCM